MEKIKRGRKPIDPNEKKIPVRIMVKKSKINELGGIENTQNYLYSKL